MLLNLRNNIHWISLILGIFVYPYIVNTSLSLGVVWLIFVVYFWLTTAMLCDVYRLDHFLFTVCSAGILIAVSIFFINGIEEVPFPEGAIIFKMDSIAQALLVFFIFSVPLIIYKHQTATHPFKHQESKSIKSPLPETTIETDEKWEEATIADLESGAFEVAEQ